MGRATAGAAGIALALVAAGAAADTLRKDYSEQELLAMLAGEGYGATQVVDDGVIEIKVNGKSHYLTIYDDGDLQMYFGITGYSLGVDDMNEWNRTRRLSRAYLDDERDPIIEADLLANAGYSERQFLEFVSVFIDTVDVFRQYLIERDRI